jgi:hypothetical protein
MLDKTGTINSRLLDHREILQQEQLSIRGYRMRFYKYTGYCQDARRRELHGFFMKMQTGSLYSMCRNDKLSKAKDLINKLGVDIVAYNKHRQNLQHLDNHNGWNQLFKGEEADV